MRTDLYMKLHTEWAAYGLTWFLKYRNSNEVLSPKNRFQNGLKRQILTHSIAKCSTCRNKLHILTGTLKCTKTSKWQKILREKIHTQNVLRRKIYRKYTYRAHIVLN